MLTYAGVPIDQLQHLPHDARRRLLRHLDAECAQAGTRNTQILDHRRAATERALTELLAAHLALPSVIAARRHALLAALTDYHDHRRTA